MIRILLAVLAFSLTSCINLWSVVDGPSDDDGYLAKARACFDEGDLDCAIEYYNKLSANYADVKISELAYIEYDKQGVGMRDFITHFGRGGDGTALTSFANGLIKLGAGATRRTAIYTAMTSAQTISDVNLRNLVKLIGAIGLVGEILAEAAGGATELLKAHLANVPAACLLNTNVPPCNAATAGACNAGTGALAATDTLGVTSTGIYGTGQSPITSVATLTATAIDVGMLNGAITDISNSLTALSASGKFNSGLLRTVQTIGVVGIAFPGCYRQVLLQSGIGG